MFSTRLAGFAVVATLIVGPAPAPAAEFEEDFGGRANGGEVSVDLEGSAPGVSPERFRTALGAHGDWYASPRYGDVWRPRVAVGWRPYYYGTWLWTDEGWYWDSDEPFSWAVYHYGRWVYDSAWGWVWVPGYQWAPAWVTWRFGVDAVGWAPLAPGVSVFVTSYPFVDFWWTFVPTVRFVGVPVYTVAHRPRETRRWFSATTPAPPRTPVAPREGLVASSPAWGGPPRRAIEERLGRAITPSRPAPSAGPAGREARERAPDRFAPRGGVERGGRDRQDVLPAPRGPQGERPALRPPSGRGQPERPEVRPSPRREQERPASQPPARGDRGRAGGGGRDRDRDR
jgi:hypothetical protein